MQYVLVANKKGLVEGCKNAVAHSRCETKNVGSSSFFYILYFTHMNALWQNLLKFYACY